MRRKGPNPGDMPNLPGYYYDASKNRYFKGKPPKPPPSPTLPSPPKHISLPRLLHSTALGASTTRSRLYAALLHPAQPSTEPIIPKMVATTTNAPQVPYTPSDTLACKLSYNRTPINIITFPDTLLAVYNYCPEFSPLSLTSYDTTVAYATCDGVYLHQIVNDRWFRRKYRIRNITTLSLSSNHLLMAGQCAKLYPLTRSTFIPQRAVLHLPLRDVLSCELTGTSKFALGTRNGRVVVHDFVGEKASFYPSGKQHSVTSLRIRGDLVWCSTMRGGTNLSAWDMRDCTAPAIVCRGHSNLCKMVGMDAAESLVIAGSDDEKVRVWDIRGGCVLSEIAIEGIVKRVKMVGWASGSPGACGVWLDTGDDVYARVVAR